MILFKTIYTHKKAISEMTEACAKSCGCWIITKGIITLLRLYTLAIIFQKETDKRTDSTL